MKDSKLTVTAFDWVPAFAQGHVRDLRVRWALEEAGFPYQVEVMTQGAQKHPSHLRRQPFGQIPTLEIDGRTLFESGAILWRIAETSDTLLPQDPAACDRVLAWVFAALNTLEPPVGMLAMLDLFIKDKEAAARIRPEIASAARDMLDKLAAVLGPEPHIAGGFSVADIVLTTVLRDVPDDLIAGYPTLRAYVDRHTARPAFRAALEGQMKPFLENAARYEAAG
ncbi:glutathione S-transferase family protein (plasmid) [Paracoccus liaowanqingii]|uniref:Glutathione S-transferase family protein n=1 Tax=Paracoccus liaowanqingii TaxID=2560053 RepID=A0A4Y5SVJ9_9RHOB|nr:glutathione S-transferase family protein [Paracoccus liaowanqingii]QDA36816.1 glutathione S-transferase family protein [Paracoccus liaowanqingii]